MLHSSGDRPAADELSPMQINGSLPMHIARAYGVNPARPANPTQAATPAAPINATPRPQPTDAYAPAAATQQNQRIDELIAGQVDQPIDFTPTPAPQSDSLQMYTRAADRIEAATSVQLGRSLDVRG